MKPRKPAILTGMMDNWEAMKSWSFDKLGEDNCNLAGECQNTTNISPVR